MARLRLCLLGPFHATLDGEPVTSFETDKVRALLAYLAVEAERPHRRQELAGLLWPDWPERSARANLRNALSNLRQAIGDRQAQPPFLLISRDSLQFNLASDHWLDVRAFEELVEADEGEESDVQRLEAALALYGAAFLEGFSLKDSAGFEDWSLLVREQVRRQRLSALGRLAQGYAGRGEHQRACEVARQRVELDPLDEEAHRALMGLYAGSGRRGDAVRQYRVAVRVLEAELGIPPSAETTALYERIRAGEEIGRAPEPGLLIPHNLPAQATLFIGREAELAELDQLIAEPHTRLVTILGPGGIGKTRLALACAERQHRAERRLDAPAPAEDGGQLRFPDGVFFAPLAALSSPVHILLTLADVLGFQPQAGGGETRSLRQQIFAFLRRKRLLLVLDNLEHLLERPPLIPPNEGKTEPFPPEGGTGGGEGAAELVAAIVRAAPTVQILATSRERLNLQEEQVYPIQGLEFPDWVAPEDALQYTAAQLFLQSARRVQPHFALETTDVATLVRICHLVGGMPLALELAAAWVDVLPLAKIVDKISTGLDFLETEWRDVPPRHRSMRAVIDGSWRQLRRDERQVCAQLSVFRGGFTREAARSVVRAGDGAQLFLRALARLVSKSLVQYDPSRDRYDVHELLRQYAAEKLDEQTGDVRDRHSEHYCAVLQRWNTDDAQGPRQAEAFRKVETDLENVRAAWEWAATRQDITRLDQALDGIWRIFWRPFKLHSGIAACQLAIDAADQVDEAAPEYVDAQRVLARATIHQAHMLSFLGRFTLARSLLDRAAKLLDREALAGHDTRAERAFLLMRTGEIEGVVDKEFAQRSLQAAAALFRELGNLYEAAWCLTLLSGVYVRFNEISAAASIIEESLALHRALGNYLGIGSSYWRLAELAHVRGDHQLAVRHYRDSLASFRAVSVFHELVILNLLADAHRMCDDFDVARQLYDESLSVARSRGQIFIETAALFGLGVLAMDAYAAQEAQGRFTDVLTIAQEHQYNWGVACALAALGDLSSFQGQFAAGADYARQSVSVVRASGQSGAAAMELCNLARAQTLSGAFDHAQVTLREASAMAGERTTRYIETLRSLHQCQLQVYTAQYESARAGAGEALRQAREMQGENPWWPERLALGVVAYTPRRGRRSGLIAQAHGVLGWAALAEGRFEAAREALGQSVALFQGLGDREYAGWALAGLGQAAWGLGERHEAQAHLLQALGTVMEIGAFIPLLHLLPIIPVVLGEEEDPGLKERAVELYALASHHPFVAKTQLFEDIAGKYIVAATETLPPDVIAAAQERGRALDWWETAEALLNELDW